MATRGGGGGGGCQPFSHSCGGKEKTRAPSMIIRLQFTRCRPEKYQSRPRFVCNLMSLDHSYSSLLIHTLYPLPIYNTTTTTMAMALNRRAARLIGVGSAAAIIALLCWTTGVGDPASRADFARQVQSYAPHNLYSPSSSEDQSSMTTGFVVDTFDKTSPPSIGCEAVVSDLQRRIVEVYAPLFEGIRHINMFGYLGMSPPGLLSNRHMCMTHSPETGGQSS